MPETILCSLIEELQRHFFKFNLTQAGHLESSQLYFVQGWLAVDNCALVVAWGTVPVKNWYHTAQSSSLTTAAGISPPKASGKFYWVIHQVQILQHPNILFKGKTKGRLALFCALYKVVSSTFCHLFLPKTEHQPM